ncbi:MAG: outer membrane protein assembly factor BamE [Betaproteobacteria bacterium]|nr:outer membrane protein assembly factor BamE [Betaproteobacteria bacterium]
MNTLTHAARTAVAVLLAIALAGCASRLGQDFDDALVQQIKPGETTKAEVRAKLGRPALVSRVGDDDVWTYAYYEGGGFGYESRKLFGQFDRNNPTGGRQKRLVVTFKGDSVKEAHFRQELPLQDPLEEAYR